MEPRDKRAPEVIIAAYGLPGRLAAEALRKAGTPHCIIELNETTVHRCEQSATPIAFGDCADPAVLIKAGVENARLLLIAIPDDDAAIRATAAARKLNAALHIVTRCQYTSSGMEARVVGADEVIVAEQLVADAFRTAAVPDR